MSLMTLLYWEWQLIPIWPLGSIFAWFLEQLLKGLVSWGSPGECSMIDHFLRDASGVLSCLFWSTVLQCGARLPIQTLNCWTVQSTPVRNCSPVCCLSSICCSSVYDVILWNKCCIRSGVTQCTRLMMRDLGSMYQCGLHAAHIGIFMRRLAAEPRSTSGLLFLSQWPSGTILLTPCSMVWDCRVSRAGPMLFYWPKLHYPYYSLLLFFYFSSSCLLVGIVWLGSSDR